MGVKLLPSTRLGDIPALVDKLLLDPQRQGVIIKEETDDLLCREGGIVVASRLSTLVENGLEENILPHQLGLACIADVGADIPPHVGDDDYVLECTVSTELSEHAEVPPGYPTHPNIRDRVKVEDTSKHVTSSVPVYGTIPSVRYEFCFFLKNWPELHVRGFEEGCYRFEDIYVAPCGIVESRSVDQDDTTAVHIVSLSRLYLTRARFQPPVNSEIGSAEEVYELFK
jgi:hypothetical protein